MNKLIISFFVLFSSNLISQIDIDWIKLRDVYYKSEYREDVDGYYQTPYFGKSVEELDNKEVRITGFMLTLSPDEDIYPCFSVLPMGFSWSLYFAQSANESLAGDVDDLSEAT